MKHTITKNIFSVWITASFLILFSLPITQAHTSIQTYSNLSLSTKHSIESRLTNFLDRIDKFDKERQNAIYRELQNKIDTMQIRYALDSEIYTLLEIIYVIATHKLDSQSILSNDEILSHVLFWENIPHYQLDESDKIQEEDLGTDDKIESKWEYRADLDTQDLNERDKNILAGTSRWILNLEVRADREWIKTEIVEFRFSENIDNIGLVGRLYKDGIFVWESSQSDTKGNILSIDNLTSLIIDTQTTNIQLELLTKTIGKEQVGKELSDVRVISTTFKDNTWVITWDAIWERVISENSRSFSIVPADVSVNLESEFNRDSSTAVIKISPLVWNNNENGNIFSPKLSGVILQVSSLSNPGNINIFNGNGIEIGSGNINWNGNIFISIHPDSISKWGEKYSITTTAEWNFRISQDGIQYSAGGNTYTSKLQQQIFLGQR